ncbi:MAG: site-2 protease family protein [Thermodesulfobacteriota bacterium]|nr:site-2 protease family protein [Thermodesulfobacteriota bacterium]
MTASISEFLRSISIFALPLLLAVMAHEVAHGWVAEKLGDPTARLMGRITFNPLVHIDPVGTVILPVALMLMNAPFLFGWAKPVPVNFANLRSGRRSMAWVAVSGPLTNLMLACLSALAYRAVLLLYATGWIHHSGLLVSIAEPVFLMARFSVVFNVVLMVINLFPVPPLDGGRILTGLLPRNWAYRVAALERYGMIIILLLIATGMWGNLLDPVLSLFLRVLLGR